jgi:hypothetical protein
MRHYMTGHHLSRDNPQERRCFVAVCEGCYESQLRGIVSSQIVFNLDRLD